MFITLKIWVVIFIEFSIWSTPGNRLCILKQERHRRRLAKAKEEKYLELQKAPLIRWADFVLFYRGRQLMKNFITYLFLLFFLSGCGYTQLKMPTFNFEIVNDKEHLSLERHPEEFIPSVGRFKKDDIFHYPNYSTQFVQPYSYWPYYPSYERRINNHHHRSSYSQSRRIIDVVNPPYIETYLRAKQPVVKEVIKAPVVTKPVDIQLKKEVWRRRTAPRRSKKVPPLTKKEE